MEPQCSPCGILTRQKRRQPMPAHSSSDAVCSEQCRAQSRQCSRHQHNIGCIPIASTSKSFERDCQCVSFGSKGFPSHLNRRGFEHSEQRHGPSFCEHSDTPARPLHPLTFRPPITINAVVFCQFLCLLPFLSIFPQQGCLLFFSSIDQWVA